MPAEGWGQHIQEYDCEFCGRRRAESVYQHPNLHEFVGMTKAEWATALHMNHHHTWDSKTETWKKRHSYRWWAEYAPLRQVDWIIRWGRYVFRKVRTYV